MMNQTLVCGKWHWVRVLNGEGADDHYEPACIDFDAHGKPSEVWFAGNDFPISADHCEIAEPVERYRR